MRWRARCTNQARLQHTVGLARPPLHPRLWPASAERTAENRAVARHLQSHNGKVSREIERKFLLKRLPPNLRHFHSRTIEQGYLAAKTDGTQIRLRKSGRHHSLTIKRGRGVSRQEIEVDLTRDQFEELWPATAGCRLTKTRYDVPFGKRTIEIDVYRGRNEGLVVAEVEFRTDQPFIAATKNIDLNRAFSKWNIIAGFC